MKLISASQNKIYTLLELEKKVQGLRIINKTIAFTNGCFDVLHIGHIHSLSAAAKEADFLVVGINSDASTKRLKGAERPINNELDRALMIASLTIVDAVVIFEEDTPLHVITHILPDVLVKGGDYTIDQIVGAKEVIANGGNVVINSIVQGFSSTGILAKIATLG